MLSYCLKYRKNTGNVNPGVSKTNNGKILILSKCAICARFIKKQKTKGILSIFGLKTPLSKVLLLGDILS